jgi:hypothetical protein
MQPFPKLWIITISPLPVLLVVCAICVTVRRKDVRSRRYVQKKVANINTFWWFSVFNVWLVFASTVTDERIHVQLHSIIDRLHSVKEIMQRLSCQRHLLTADPASDALRCRNATLGGKRTAKTSPAAAFTYGTNCSCSSMFQYLSRDVTRCSFLLLSVMPRGYFKGTTFVFFRCTRRGKI